jgi:hypothetical protein
MGNGLKRAFAAAKATRETESAKIKRMMRMAAKTAAKWYLDPKTGRPVERDFGEVVALMHSEVSEALEAYRKGLVDDKLPHRQGIEVELADMLIRMFDTCARKKIPLADAVRDVRKHRIFPLRPNVAAVLSDIHLCLSCAHQNRGGVLELGSSRLVIRADSYGFAAAYIYAHELARFMKLDLDSAIIEKNKFNATRKDHTAEARLAKGGKKF